MSASAAARREWQWGWVIAFLANLPLPLILGFGVTKEGGWFGLLAALPLLWWCGHVAVERVPGLRAPLVVGSALVAPVQLLGVVHMLAGLVALRVVGALSESSTRMSEAQAFFATVLTAGQLLCVALFLGGALTWVAAQLRGTDPP